MSGIDFREIDVPKAAKQIHITHMARNNQKFLIQYQYTGHDNQPITLDILFEIQETLYDTLEEFRKAAIKKPGLKTNPQLVQQIMLALQGDEYCRKILSYREYSAEELTAAEASIGIGIGIGESTSITDNTDDKEEQQEAYASSVSDPDYDDEGRPLLSVTGLLRQNPGRYRVTGVIDIVGKPFKLFTEVIFRCRREKCPRINFPERYILDTPIYTLDDWTIAFKDKIAGWERRAKCHSCHQRREPQLNTNTFENAKAIHLKNTKSAKAVKANPTLGLEDVVILVTNKHTLSVGLGEEVEMVGELYVLTSALVTSRFGSGHGSNFSRAGESGRCQPVFYAQRIKYTKRERELELTPADVEAIKRFASYPNLIDRLVSMMSPEVYGNEEVKLGLLLAAVKGSPKIKKNWYRRPWINLGLIGDIGTAKTSLTKDAKKLVPGSQSVSGQHSSGKGAVAVAERAAGSGEPMLRAGAAVLANKALLTIDELGTMDYEDQEQFLSLMENGYFDFNKMGIRQRLESDAGYIVNSNTISGNWKYPDRVSVDEIPLKGQLIDRLDLVFIFRKHQTQEQSDAFADSMHKLSTKHFNLDFKFLRKYIYAINSNPEFDNIEFEDDADTLTLRDFWKNLMRVNPEFAGNRSYESLFKIATAFARLMRKTKVDSEVIAYTIEYENKVFAKHGTQVSTPVDYFSMTYLEICNIIKKHSQEKYWIETNSPNVAQLQDISFNQAAELAAGKNNKVSEYLGKNFRSSVSKSARRLREKFRDSQDKDFDDGKIKVVSTDAHHELRLRWIPNNSNNNTEQSNKQNE